MVPIRQAGGVAHDPMRGLTDAQRRAVASLASVDRDFIGLRVGRLPGREAVAAELVAAGWCVRWSAGRKCPEYLFLTPWAMERLGLDVEEHPVWRDEDGQPAGGYWDDTPKLAYALPRGVNPRKPIRLPRIPGAHALPYPDLIPINDREWYEDADPGAAPIPAPPPVEDGWGNPVRVAGVPLHRGVDLAMVRKILARDRREATKRAKAKKLRPDHPGAAPRNPPRGGARTRPDRPRSDAHRGGLRGGLEPLDSR